MLQWVGDLGLFCWRVAKALATPPFERAEFFRQLDAIGAKSLPLAAWQVRLPASCSHFKRATA